LKYQTLTRVLVTTLVLISVFAAGHWSAVSFAAQSSPKWEYRMLRADRVDEIGGVTTVKGLAPLGDEGWEVAGLNTSWVLLKRAAK
jgi:hypothetical protein